MFSRPVRPNSGFAVPGYTFGTPYEMRTARRHQTRTNRPTSIRHPCTASHASQCCQTEHAGVANTQRHDRSIRSLLLILVHAESCIRVIKSSRAPRSLRWLLSDGVHAFGFRVEATARAPQFRKASGSTCGKRRQRASSASAETLACASARSSATGSPSRELELAQNARSASERGLLRRAQLF